MPLPFNNFEINLNQENTHPFNFRDHYRNTVRDLHYNEKQSRKVVEALEGVLGCDFTKDLEAVSSPLTRSKSPRLKELGKCVKGMFNIRHFLKHLYTYFASKVNYIFITSSFSCR